jgi:thiosulfate/3-mercaptopyruvate sulfurtransferase
MTTRQGYAHPELLAETDWLASHLTDANVRVIDCEAFDAYRRAHIPGSVGLRVNPFIKDANNSVYVMPPDQFARLMSELGVSSDTTVVTYDAGGVTAARMWWVLNYYGHTNVKMLNGGWVKWLMEGRPVTHQATTVKPATFTPRTQPQALCTLDYAKGVIDGKSAVLLDVRTDGEWTGENSRGNKRAGHMPGAVHIEWTRFMTDQEPRVVRPAAELRAMLAQHGITPEREVVTY